jgi:hypothetical protein
VTVGAVDQISSVFTFTPWPCRTGPRGCAVNAEEGPSSHNEDRTGATAARLGPTVSANDRSRETSRWRLCNVRGHFIDGMHAWIRVVGDDDDEDDN